LGVSTFFDFQYSSEETTFVGVVVSMTFVSSVSFDFCLYVLKIKSNRMIKTKIPKRIYNFLFVELISLLLFKIVLSFSRGNYISFLASSIKSFSSILTGAVQLGHLKILQANLS
jgi:hypothetical protein